MNNRPYILDCLSSNRCKASQISPKVANPFSQILNSKANLLFIPFTYNARKENLIKATATPNGLNWRQIEISRLAKTPIRALWLVLMTYGAAFFLPLYFFCLFPPGSHGIDDQKYFLPHLMQFFSGSAQS